MTDHADIAAQIEADRIASGLAMIVTVMPAGAPGECTECGEMMPRLVAGRCGFCRDGRRPPLSFYDARPASAPIAAAPVHQEETTAMTKIPEKQAITMPCEGVLVQLIHARASQDELSLGRAAMIMLEEGLAARDAPAMAVEYSLEGAAPNQDVSVDILLHNVPDNDLAAEVARRLTSGPGSDDYDEALGRAAAAEAKLATLRAALAE